VDVAIACTPVPTAVAGAAAAVAPGGTLCLYAPPPPGTGLELDAFALYRAEIDIRPSYSAGPADMRAALALIASGAVDPAPLVTHRLPLAETAAALALARDHEALKALVVP
jgi:L-iditol 2-dehydrogenase